MVYTAYMSNIRKFNYNLVPCNINTSPHILMEVEQERHKGNWSLRGFTFHMLHFHVCWRKGSFFLVSKYVPQIGSVPPIFKATHMQKKRLKYHQGLAWRPSSWTNDQNLTYRQMTFQRTHKASQKGWKLHSWKNNTQTFLLQGSLQNLQIDRISLQKIFPPTISQSIQSWKLKGPTPPPPRKLPGLRRDWPFHEALLEVTLGVPWTLPSSLCLSAIQHQPWEVKVETLTAYMRNTRIHTYNLERRITLPEKKNIIPANWWLENDNSFFEVLIVFPFQRGHASIFQGVWFF